MGLPADLLDGQGRGPDPVVGVAVVPGRVLRQVQVFAFVLERCLEMKKKLTLTPFLRNICVIDIQISIKDHFNFNVFWET